MLKVDTNKKSHLQKIAIQVNQVPASKVFRGYSQGAKNKAVIAFISLTHIEFWITYKLTCKGPELKMQAETEGKCRYVSVSVLARKIQ